MDDDQALVLAWRGGDSHAGEELFERYYKRVVKFFLNKVGEQGTDLVQRTFLACLEALPRYRGEGSFRSFLFAIAYRQLCSFYERQRRGQIDFGTVSVADLDPSPSRMLAHREEEELLLTALRLLLEAQVILELYYWEQLVVAEIAVLLQVPLGTAKARLRRARLLLKEKLDGQTTSALGASMLEGIDEWAEMVCASPSR